MVEAMLVVRKFRRLTPVLRADTESVIWIP
jgi:hypothetical protein